MFSGYSVGGVRAALTGIGLLEAARWRALFWIGAAAGGILLLVVAAALPESPGHLAGRGRLGAIVGPLDGGLVLSAGWGLEAEFVAFALPAVLGAVLILLVPAPAGQPTADGPDPGGR